MGEPVFFPLFVDISKKNFLIIGGGKIALRRVQTLLGFTRNLTIVSPELQDDLELLVKKENLDWKKDFYNKEYLDGADYVLAATNDPICNETVVADCKKRRIPVNASHRKELCDFYFPSIVQEDHMVVGICGSGLDHRMVKETRIKIQDALQSKDVSKDEIKQKE
ncbi:MAG: bifunctional precorrin-2 dehydrogenase/sirohydrochlorin ferrochelatase [Dorea sp.]|nr:bifunctional precorrin-2 dehydrogenase/sirohydrochlorin ferrochelatase [Dorea sp.]